MLKLGLSLLLTAPVSLAAVPLGPVGRLTETAPKRQDLSIMGDVDSFSALLKERREVVLGERRREIGNWTWDYGTNDWLELESMRVDYLFGTQQISFGQATSSKVSDYYTDYFVDSADPAVSGAGSPGFKFDPRQKSGTVVHAVDKGRGGRPVFIAVGDKKYDWKFRSAPVNPDLSPAIGSYRTWITASGRFGTSTEDPMVLSDSLFDGRTMKHPEAALPAFPEGISLGNGRLLYVPDASAHTSEQTGWGGIYGTTPIYADTYTSMGVNGWKWSTSALPRTYYYDPYQLFALDRVGYDPSHGSGGGYYHQLGLNNELIRGAVGAYFDSSTEGLLDAELGDAVISSGIAPSTGTQAGMPASISNQPSFSGFGGKIAYWESLHNFSELRWGPSSWVDPALLSPNQYDQYWANVRKLREALSELHRRPAANATQENSHLFNYANYLQTKQSVRDYVASSKTFPSVDWVRSLFSVTSGQTGAKTAIGRSPWVKGALDYRLDASSLDDLLFVLPFLRISEWARFATDGADNWDNSRFLSNVGVSSQSVAGIETRYSTFDEVLAGRNRFYINDVSTSSDGKIKFGVGVDIVSDLQSAAIPSGEHWSEPETAIKVQGYSPGSLSLKTGLVKSNLPTIAPEGGDPLSTVVQGTDASGNNYFSFLKSGFRIVELNKLDSSLQIVLKDGAAGLAPSEAVATSEELRSAFQALRSRLTLKGSDQTETAFPFALQNPYDKTWTYDIDERALTITPDDSAGTVKVEYVDQDKGVHTSVITGFKGYKTPANNSGGADVPSGSPIAGDSTGTGFPAWAIALASVGGAAVFGGLGWFLAARRRTVRRRHKKARRRDGTDLG